MVRASDGHTCTPVLCYALMMKPISASTLHCAMAVQHNLALMPSHGMCQGSQNSDVQSETVGCRQGCPETF